MPKILFYDLETMFAVAAVWQAKTRFVSTEQLISEPYIVQLIGKQPELLPSHLQRVNLWFLWVERW